MSSISRSIFIYLGLIAAAGLAAAQGGPGPGYDQDSGPAPKAQPEAIKPAAEDQSTIKVNVDLVNIFFTVRAKKGGQIDPHLSQSDFQIFEDGKQQNIHQFARESDLPLTLGLLIDISASQERLIDVEQAAASQFFFDVVRPKDQALLISFGKSVDLLQDYTSSPKILSAGLKDIRGDSNAPMISSSGPIPNTNPGPVGGSVGTPKGTLLFDAVCLVSNEKLRSEVGRKAIILITDGEDEGSTNKLRDAVDAAQKADAIIYSIYYVDRQFYGGYGLMVGGGESDLRKMSEQTGGRVFTVDRHHTLKDVFQEIQDELRNQYSIAYTPSNANRNGDFRKINIKVDKDEDRVQARAGYYATPNDGQ